MEREGLVVGLPGCIVLVCPGGGGPVGQSVATLGKPRESQGLKVEPQALLLPFLLTLNDLLINARVGDAPGEDTLQNRTAGKVCVGRGVGCSFPPPH